MGGDLEVHRLRDLLPFRRLVFDDTDFLEFGGMGGCSCCPPNLGSIPSRLSLTPRVGVYCHRSEQFARSPLSEEPNLGGPVLEVVVTRSLGISPDGRRLAVELLHFSQAMSGGQGSAAGVLRGADRSGYVLASAHVRSFCSRPM
jgi:hypothetical protein